ncbi:MAG TPA: hypothetical protein VHB79_27500 [Polyangiaceae bacterium]|nr:hypothetical protein [Polyangiaceae bacterium]
MKAGARFAILSVITLGCATEASDPPSNGFGSFGGSSAAEAGAGGSVATGGTSAPTAGTSSAGTTVLPEGGTTGTAGTFGAAGTFGTSGTFGTAGTFVTAGTDAGGTGAGGTAAAGGKGGTGSGGTATAGTASTGGGGSGTAGTGGTGVVANYCDSQAKSPLPFTVNDGYQPSGWQGDFAAISVPTVQPDACAARPANAVGTCSVWRYTPNAVTPAWSGVAWSRVWDANYTHPPVCLAAGATKLTFQARGAAGGEVVTFSGAGGPEVPFTLTNAWKQYEVSLAGVVYNTPADGVPAGFFWKVAPPTPNNAAVTFFVDDIKIIK